MQGKYTCVLGVGKRPRVWIPWHLPTCRDRSRSLWPLLFHQSVRLPVQHQLGNRQLCRVLWRDVFDRSMWCATLPTAIRSPQMSITLVFSVFVVVSSALPDVITSSTPNGHTDLRTPELAAVILVKHCEEQSRQLEDLFWAVSNPDSPTVGQYPSRDVVNALLAPCPATTAAVEEVCAAIRDTRYAPRLCVPCGSIICNMSVLFVAKARVRCPLRGGTVVAMELDNFGVTLIRLLGFPVALVLPPPLRIHSVLV